MPEYTSAPPTALSESVAPVKKPQSTRRRRRPTCSYKISFDRTNQVIYNIDPDGDVVHAVRVKPVGKGKKTLNETAAEAVTASPAIRKGRPKGSKNKLSSNSFNDRCQKRSFKYTFAGPTECKKCGMMFDGDPLVHCTKHHKNACPICGQTLKTPLTGHIRSHGTQQLALTVECYECYDCKEKFGNITTMEEHIRNEPLKTVTDLKCMICEGVQFTDHVTLVDHLVATHCPRKVFNRPAVYRCRACQAGFKSQINVLRHACNSIKSPHCIQCDKTFPSKMRYSFHLQFHEHPKCAPMHLHCDLCLAEFDDEYHLYDHIRFRHELHDKAVCEVCGRMFKSSMGLNIHRRYHNGSRNFTCKSCDKSFLNKSTLREHEISHMDVKPFQCQICGQYLSRASRLRSHVKAHRAAESTEQLCYCCDSCGFVAPDQSLINEHVDKHGCTGSTVDHLSSVVKCEYCDSTYVNAEDLNEHRNTAHGNGVDNAEPFICVVCSSTFSTYSRLTTHKLTHGINMESTLPDTGEPSEIADRHRFDIPQYFSCQYCAKMCLHYTYFCLHRRLKHPPGVQTYTCDQCSIVFKTSWKLAYHKKTVHGQSVNKPPEKYVCTVCNRKFIKIGALNLHKTRSHIDAVGDVCKYLCQICGKFFSSECSLRNHSKLHGSKPVERRNSDRNLNRTFNRKPKATETISTVNAVHSPYYVKATVAPATTAASDSAAEFVERAARCNETVLPTGMTCDLCDVRFDDSTQHKLHLDNHVVMDLVFMCQSCYVPFLSATAYDVHVNIMLCPTQPQARPDVRFVTGGGAHVSESVDVQPLVVDCSKIFGPDTKPDPTEPERKLELAETETTVDQTEQAAPLEETLSVLDQSPGMTILDELYSIISTPRTSAALEAIDFQTPPDPPNLNAYHCGFAFSP